ncbi:MAG: hypothetical protein ACLU5J_06525 [Christensenellales bacterium]
MRCDTINNFDTKGVKWAEVLDAEEIAKIMVAFYKETVDDKVSYQAALKRVEENISDFVIIKIKKRIVSIAKKTRETDCLCSISAVYTIEKERKRIFKKIVSFLTNYIVTNHKIAYLLSIRIIRYQIIYIKVLDMYMINHSLSLYIKVINNFSK